MMTVFCKCSRHVAHQVRFSAGLFMPCCKCYMWPSGTLRSRLSSILPADRILVRFPINGNPWWSANHILIYRNLCSTKQNEPSHSNIRQSGHMCLLPFSIAMVSSFHRGNVLCLKWPIMLATLWAHPHEPSEAAPEFRVVVADTLSSQQLSCFVP